MKNLTLVNCDTDSISVCKHDQTPFTEEEADSLLSELNSLYPENIKWDDDGMFDCVVVLKTKNYILYDGKSIKKKGSSIKDPKREKALREFLDRIIDAIVFNKGGYLDIYNEYVKEINSIQDINRWACRKTITEKIFSSERSNETKVKDAIEDTEYVEGDRVYMYYTPEKQLKLVEQFDNDYNRDHLFKKLHSTALIFNTVLPIKDNFLNYSLKRNKKALETLLTT